MDRITRFAFLMFAAVAVALGAQRLSVAEPLPLATEDVATPNHDARHAAETMASNPEMMLAEPVDAAPSALSFVTADKMLYARANARLRAGPSTASGILTRLPADAPLHAIARSSDGAWWKVSLADKRIGYVHRNVVMNSPATKMALLPVPTEPAPMPVTRASAAPGSGRPTSGVLGFIADAMDWIADKAGTAGTGRPSSPRVTRSTR